MSASISKSGFGFFIASLFSLGFASPGDLVNSATSRQVGRSAQRREGCLSWETDSDWCSQSMDEPVVALQLQTRVLKRSNKLGVEHSRHVTADEKQKMDGKTADQSGTFHGEAVGFFQMGKPEVTHRTTRTPSSRDVVEAAASRVEAPESGRETKVSVTEQAMPSSILPLKSLDNGFASMERVATIPTTLRSETSANSSVVAMSTVALVAACYMVLTRGWKKYGRYAWKLYFGSCGRKSRTAPEPTEAVRSTKPGFRRPALADASASLVIPLVPFRATVDGHVSFDVTERDRGAIVNASLTRLPGEQAWTKIEFSVRGEASSSKMSPSLSCSRMESESDMETHAIQGALDSWFSLLYHDKTLHDDPENMSGDIEDSQSESEHAFGKDADTSPAQEGVQPRTRKKRQPLGLAIRDGMGNASGTIEADPSGRCVYRHGESKLEIDSGHDGNLVVVLKDGKKQAVANGFKGETRTEAVNEEQADFLQVDSLIGPEDPDFLQVLMCVLAPVAFNR